MVVQYAHPIMFATVALVAVGIAVYEYVQYKKNQDKMQHKNKPSRPVSTVLILPQTPKKLSNDSESPADSQPSSEISCAGRGSTNSSDSTINTLRKRKTSSFTETESPPPYSALSDSVNMIQVNSDTKTFNKTIIDEVSEDSNLSGVSKTSTSKKQSARRQKAHKSIKQSENAGYNNLDADNKHKDKHRSIGSSRSRQSMNITEGSGSTRRSKSSAATKKSHGRFTSASTHTSNSSCSSLDSEKDMYKRKVRDYLKNDVGSDKISEDLESTMDFANENFLGCISTVSGLCKACEENRINARAIPCNHDHLCIDCALKVFRIWRRCNFCHTVIREFKVIGN